MFLRVFFVSFVVDVFSVYGRFESFAISLDTMTLESSAIP